MKQINITLFFLLTLMATNLQAQRYLEEIFTDVDVTGDVFYGTNATVLLLADPNVGEAIPQPLFFDFYEPQGDDLEERPVILYYHTGNFLPQPQACSITGTQDDLLVQEMATRLAKMGYVVAVPQYRLGWNPLGSTQDERVFTLINAAYRGVQDARTMVRYLKKEVVENANPLGIDTSRITVWGQGTGGYISLASATLDAYTDVLLPKFTTVIGGVPIPMVIEAANGDIWGTSVGIVPPGSPPPFTVGDTLCYPNHVGYNSDFQLCVNMGGALGDTSWLDASDPPMISYQVPNDSLAPYTEGILIVSTTGEQIVEVQGARVIQEKVASLGNNDVFANEDWIDEYSTRANEVNEGFDGLFPFVYPSFPDPTSPGDVITVSGPWDWWVPEDWDDVFCDLAPGIDLHTQNILGHPEMSEELGMTYVDSILGYFAPRACLALDLGCDISEYVGTNEIIKGESVGLNIAPNPATSEIYLKTFEDKPMLDVFLFDMSGRMMETYIDIRQNNLIIERGDLPRGMYTVRIRFEEGMAVQKIVFE